MTYKPTNCPRCGGSGFDTWLGKEVCDCPAGDEVGAILDAHAQGMRLRENAKRSRAKPRSPVVADDAPGLKPGSPDEG